MADERSWAPFEFEGLVISNNTGLFDYCVHLYGNGNKVQAVKFARAYIARCVAVGFEAEDARLNVIYLIGYFGSPESVAAIREWWGAAFRAARTTLAA